MSGKAFIKKWDAGLFNGEADTPAVTRVAMLLPWPVTLLAKPFTLSFSSSASSVLLYRRGDFSQGKPRVNGGPYALTVGKGQQKDKFPLPGGDFYLSVLMNYTIVEAPGARGPYKLKVRATSIP